MQIADNPVTFNPQDIENPFLALGNSNLQFMINSNPLFRDNKPEDGWELMSYNDGSKYSGINDFRTSDYSFPYLILYNKFRSILRVFVLYNKSQFNMDYNTGSIVIRFQRPQGNTFTQSANFTSLNVSYEAIDYFPKRLHGQVPNLVSGNEYQWLFGDFPMAYDPCVCEFTYDKINITVNLVDEAKVKLDGTLSTFNITNKSGTVTNFSQGLAGGTEIGKDLTKGLKGFKDDADLVNNAVSLMTRLNARLILKNLEKQKE